MNRVSTGIKGLDEILEGGFPETSSVLVYGAAGTMKSIIGLQFLYEGATKGEPGLMVSIEEYDTDFQWYAEEFGWDIPSLQQQNLMTFTNYDPTELTKFDIKTLRSDVIIQLTRLIEEAGIKRVVFDSITPIALSLEDKGQFRTIIYTLTKALKEKGVTTVFISENGNQEHVEAYVTAGLVGAIILGLIATTVFNDPKIILIAAVSGTFGNLLDSWIGAVIENRGYLDNAGTNFFATAGGSLVGILLGAFL